MIIHLGRDAATGFFRYVPEKFFLVVACSLLVPYLFVVAPLTQYVHGTERFLHVVHSALAWAGAPGSMPTGFLELARQSGPKTLLRFGGQTKAWDEELGAGPYFSDPRSPGRSWGRGETVAEWFSRVRSLSDPYARTVSFDTHMNPSMYTVIGYFPFVIPAFIGVLAEAQPIYILYACILSNALLSITLGYWVIRVTPVLKWLHVFILLLPSVCMNRMLIMPDAATLSLCLLLIAVVMRLRAAGHLLPRQLKFGLVGLSLLVGLVKNVYFLVPMIGWLIPSGGFQGLRRKLLWIGVATLGTLAAAVLWNMQVMPSIGAGMASIDPARPRLWNLLLKIAQLPLERLQWAHWLNNVFLWNISAAETAYAPTNLTLVLPGGALLAALTFLPERNAPGFSLLARERLLCAAVFFATVVIIIAAVSIKTHTVSAQGRYFLPVWPLLALIFYRRADSVGRAHGLYPQLVSFSACWWGVIHVYMVYTLSGL